MFGKIKVDISQIMATSKMSLKLSCLRACNNNLSEAEKLYDYLVRDIADLPDVDPIPPTTMQQIKQSAEEIFGWVNSHSEDIAKGWSFIQMMRGNAPTAATPPANVPPIP